MKLNITAAFGIWTLALLAGCATPASEGSEAGDVVESGDELASLTTLATKQKYPGDFVQLGDQMYWQGIHNASSQEYSAYFGYLWKASLKGATAGKEVLKGTNYIMSSMTKFADGVVFVDAASCSVSFLSEKNFKAKASPVTVLHAWAEGNGGLEEGECQAAAIDVDARGVYVVLKDGYVSYSPYANGKFEGGRTLGHVPAGDSTNGNDSEYVTATRVVGGKLFVATEVHHTGSVGAEPSSNVGKLYSLPLSSSKAELKATVVATLKGGGPSQGALQSVGDALLVGDGAPNGAGSIVSYPAAGGAPKVLVRDAGTVIRGLAADARAMYWSDGKAGKVYKANTDGSAKGLYASVKEAADLKLTADSLWISSWEMTKGKTTDEGQSSFYAGKVLVGKR